MPNKDFDYTKHEHWPKKVEPRGEIPARADILDIDPATYLRRVFDPQRYYAVPNKVFMADEVVGLARQLGVLLDMEVKVELSNTELYIELNFDEMPVMGDLKLQLLTLLGMVDEVSFFRPENGEHDFRLALLYKTHLYIRKATDFAPREKL